MNYNIELKERKAQPVLSIRKTTPVGNLPQEIGVAYSSIIQYLGGMGEQPVEAAYTAYYNMDMEHLDVEMGFPVARELPGKDNMTSGEIPGGRYVECMHKGPYAEIGPVYEAMNKWVADNGLEASGISYEFYYNSPMEVPESELLTKVLFPLK